MKENILKKYKIDKVVKGPADIIVNVKSKKGIEPNTITYNQIKTDIRSELSNYLYEQTECKPMIIAVVQEV